MLCALSGKDAVEPVVSAVSGKVYERAVIETWIAERGTDPATGAPLTAQQLVRLDLVPANPPLTVATSIPALLGALQTEFNAMAIENFDLRQQDTQRRAELDESHRKLDAALRVITRLTLERDELRHALEVLDVNAELPPSPLDPQGSNAQGLSDAPTRAPQVEGQGTAADAPADNASSVVSDVSSSQNAALRGTARAQSAPQPAEEAHMDVEQPAAADLLGQNEPEIPRMPLVVQHGSAAWNNIAAARQELSATRKEFNVAVATTAFPYRSPLQLADVSGDSLRIYRHWALVTSAGEDKLYDLRTQKPLTVDYPTSAKKMAFVHDEEKPLLLIFDKRRFVVVDLNTLRVARDKTTLGNPIDASRHPAGPILVQFASKIDAYDFDSLVAIDSMTVNGYGRGRHAVHPDGEYLIWATLATQLSFYSFIKQEKVRVVEAWDRVSCITPSANGFHVAYFEGTNVAILDLREDGQPHRIHLPYGAPRQLSFDSTGRRLQVSTANVVLIYERNKQKEHSNAWVRREHSDCDANLIVAWSGDKLQIPVGISDVQTQS